MNIVFKNGFLIEPKPSSAQLVLLTIAFFLTTLHEFYVVTPIGFLRIFEFAGIGLFIIAICAFGGRFFQTKYCIFCILITLVCYAVPFYTNMVTSNTPVYWNTVVGLPISLFFACVFLYVFSLRSQALLRVLKNVLWVHLIAFYVQFFVFLTTGTVINYLFFLEREQRMTGGSFVEESMIRCSGLTGEPAAFALLVMQLFFAIFFAENKKSNIRLVVATVAAVLLAFSSMGYFYLAVFLLCFFFPKIKSLKVFIPILIFGLVAFFGAFIVAHSQMFAAYTKLINFQDSSSYQFRIGSFLTYACEEPWEALWGKGLGMQELVMTSRGELVGSGSTYSSVFLACGLVLGGFIFFAVWRLFARYNVPINARIMVFAFFCGTRMPPQFLFWATIFIVVLMSRIYNVSNAPKVLNHENHRFYPNV